MLIIIIILVIDGADILMQCNIFFCYSETYGSVSKKCSLGDGY